MGKIGYKPTEETKRKQSEALKGRFMGEEHPNWKGETISYWGVHTWIHKKYGKAILCELKDETCSTHFEWSNKSGGYSRTRDDWQQLCISHHRRYDGAKPIPVYGENHGLAKLTTYTVKEIRTLYKQGDVSQRELARQFLVKQSTIWNIVNNKTWVKT